MKKIIEMILSKKKVIALALAAVMLVSSIFIFPIRRNDNRGHSTLLLDTQTALAAERTFDAVGVTRNEEAAAAPLLLPIDEILSGQTQRDGYILAPTLFELDGIDPASAFVLQIPADYGTRAPAISIDGQAPPDITREADDTFVVTPAISLTPNSVYVFRLTRDGEPDITWAFQTARRFEITSTLPRNQSANVPVRTGIEITFPFGDAPDIEDYFGIYPRVSGSFTSRDSTAIFVPAQPLLYGQIYTVTISAGVSAPNTGDVIPTDYTFSFETAPATPSSKERASRVHFFERHIEFPSFAAPSVDFWHSHDENGGRQTINMTVYRIADRATAIAATNRLTEIPHWSQISQANRFVNTSDLRRVYSSRFNARQGDVWGRQETFAMQDSLSPGFYVLNAAVDGSNDQVIIQITNLAVQLIADDNKTLVWANDMTTGLPAIGAEVYDPITNKAYETSEYGIAVVERMLSTGEYLIVTAADGNESVVFAQSSGFQSFHHHWRHWDDWGWSNWDWSPRQPSRQAENNDYWTVLQLDRTLFQRSDTVSLWGFVRNRHHDEPIPYVTAVLTEHAWWHDTERDTLYTQNIPITDGAYSGEIRLPHLDPGFYELAIFHHDIALSSMFFDVKDYVKPPYQLTVSADQTAIFAGEGVTFTVGAEFFEGTSVPDLDISYVTHSWGLSVQGDGNMNEAYTNLDGVVEVRVTPIAETGTAQDPVQEERQLHFMADATLPEIGWVHEEASVRVFINDIVVRPQAMRTGRDASLTVNVHDITLDRINDGTAEYWGDFLCEPTAGQAISVEIFEVYWERMRDGSRYDHITRQVVSWYRYERRERSLERFELTTDAAGIAEKSFQVPDRHNVSYQARLTTTDGNGRTIRHQVFLGCDFTRFHENAGDEHPFLYGANDGGYDIGDEVELTIMRGTEPVTQGNVLFVVVQNGILSYHIGANPLTFTFGAQHVPNAQVFAYHFNGHTYTAGGAMSQQLLFNTTSRNLTVNVSACEEAYRPGDTATVSVTVTDEDGNPRAATVNLSLVDEALFALMDYTVDTLAMLYGSVNDRLRFSIATHRTFVSDGIEEEDDSETFTRWSTMEDSAPVAEAAESYGGVGGGDAARVRERFEDTAMFASLHTNEQGEAEFTFPLPDNITAWRMTVSAISDDLYAGNSVGALRVTQPMFVHYALNDTFLVGDTPYIGVNAYGTSFSGGEQITFEVWRESVPSDIRRATGASFERVNIPLWEMAEEGFGELVIRATADNGYSDALRHSYQVLNSHRHVDAAVFYDDITPDTVFDVTAGGLTNITFTDQGRGQFLNDLLRLRRTWHSGARIEGLVARREATRLIQLHFSDVELFGEAGDFDITDYQTENGGIAILPYAYDDLQTTVALLPFILDDVNLPALRGYLYTIYTESATENRIIALYGLALLGEPVLLDLRNYALLPDLSVQDAAYVALGLAALGEIQPARDLFDSRIAPHIQSIAPYYRVNAGGNRAEILGATSITALLAAQLGLPESFGLHAYATRHRPDELLTDIEQLTFISHEIEHHTNEAASITYTLFGERVTRDLDRHGFTLRIPARSMHEFNLISVSGDVGAVSVVRTPPEDMTVLENDITVRRTFFRAGTNVSPDSFEQGDLVRVQITIDYSAAAISGSYVITDFLPAGLVHVENSPRFGDSLQPPGWRTHVTSEGQRITFFVWNGRFDRVHTYYYYARVVTPGTFRAEGTLVQSLGAREYLVVGEDAVLMINP